MLPIVDDENDRGKSYDLYSRLLKERIVQLDGPVDITSAALVRNQLIYLDSLEVKDISLYINSPGGAVDSGLAIVDTMNFIKSDVATYCIGTAASMGAVIFSAGTKGKRYVSENSEVMIHQPSGGAQGKAEDIYVAADHMKRTQEKLYNIIAKNCNRAIEEVKDSSRTDCYMSATQAIEFGIADKVLGE